MSLQEAEAIFGGGEVEDTEDIGELSDAEILFLRSPGLPIIDPRLLPSARPKDSFGGALQFGDPEVETIFEVSEEGYLTVGATSLANMDDLDLIILNTLLENAGEWTRREQVFNNDFHDTASPSARGQMYKMRLVEIIRKLNGIEPSEAPIREGVIRAEGRRFSRKYMIPGGIWIDHRFNDRYDPYQAAVGFLRGRASIPIIRNLKDIREIQRAQRHFFDRTRSSDILRVRFQQLSTQNNQYLLDADLSNPNSLTSQLRLAYERAKNGVRRVYALDDSESGWKGKAACRGNGGILLNTVFYAPDSPPSKDGEKSKGEKKQDRLDREARAKEICGSCSVRAQCLEYALTNGEKKGVWGGTTEDERFPKKSRRKTQPTESTL